MYVYTHAYLYCVLFVERMLLWCSFCSLCLSFWCQVSRQQTIKLLLILCLHLWRLKNNNKKNTHTHTHTLFHLICFVVLFGELLPWSNYQSLWRQAPCWSHLVHLVLSWSLILDLSGPWLTFCSTSIALFYIVDILIYFLNKVKWLYSTLISSRNFLYIHSEFSFLWG